MKEQQASPAASFGAWLRRAVLIALILLLAMCCYFVYRMSMLVYRVEESVVAVSADVKEVTATVATFSRDVSAIREDIGKLKERAQKSIPYEEARHAMEEALAIGAAAKADSSALSPTAEREISALLKSLAFSGCTAEVRGREQSVLTLYGALYGKYKLKKNTLTSAEDFIDQVATKNMLGTTYFLVDKASERVQLSTWLTDRLKAIRAEEVPDSAIDHEQ